MKITKFGHCCLLVEEGNLKVLVDPGAWNELPEDLLNLDLLLITHEHPDHLDLDKIKHIISQNPNIQIFTNKGVGKVLDQNQIPYQLLELGQTTTIKDVLIETFGKIHAEVYPTLPSVDNTGFLINNKLFIPGDNFTDPGKAVEILAVPISAPWLKLSESIDYAKKLKPKLAFPVHDGALKYAGPSFSLPEKVLAIEGVKFIIPKLGQPF